MSRNKKARKDDLIEFVRTDLHDKNISPHILGNVEYYVRRAISNMQDTGILPPSELSFVSGVEVNEHLDGAGGFSYNYYRLPEDFAEVVKFLVNGRELHTYEPEPVQLQTASSVKQRHLFSVDTLDIHIPGGTEGVLALLAAPFPKDNDVITLRYMTDGVNFDMSKLSAVYNEPLLFEVHKMLGIVPADATNRVALDRADRWQNPTSQRKDNGSLTTTRGTLFAKARFPKRGYRMGRLRRADE